jgi:hypothetical protein
MPAKSKAQQRLMGMALAAKRGKGHFSGKVQEAADSMSEKQLRDFAKTKTDKLPEKKAFVGGFVKRAAEYGLDKDKSLRLLKNAYGVYDDAGETERWYDGGPMWNEQLNKKIKGFYKKPDHVAAMTKAFAESAKRQGADLQFMAEPHSAEYMTPEKALSNILEKQKLDLGDSTLPNYYNLEYPLKKRKGLLELLRLRSPGTIDVWPEGHPAELAAKEYTKYLNQ